MEIPKGEAPNRNPLLIKPESVTSITGLRIPREEYRGVDCSILTILGDRFTVIGTPYEIEQKLREGQ